MPADINAKRYVWYMSDDPAARIVAYEWWPEGEFLSSMTLGRLYLKKRDDPGDVWEPAMLIGSLPWVVTQSFVRDQGFKVEVAEHE
jgi:hypothetical protein